MASTERYKKKQYRVELTCGHFRYYYNTPSGGDEVYCTTCDAGSIVGAVEGKLYGVKVVNVEGDFWSQRITSRYYKAGCMMEGCEYETIGTEYYKLEETMHIHYMRTHTSFGGTLEIREGRRRETTDDDQPGF